MRRQTRPVEPGPILSDRTGRLPKRRANSQRNPMSAEVRESAVRIQTGKALRILTNELEAPAPEIAGLHKRRWPIELLFRWVKQNLKTTRFLGTSENAVRIQIATDLIAFLLLRVAQQSRAAITAPLTFARLVRDNLMHRRPFTHLAKSPCQRSL